MTGRSQALLASITMCILLLAAAARSEEPGEAYRWQPGPGEAKLGEQAKLTLPEGYAFLGPEDAQRALKAMGNFPSGSELGLVTGGTKEEDWFAVIRFIDAGYVKDEEADSWDADAMLQSIREGTEEANERRKELGFAPLIIRGWEEKPHYDRNNNKVVWAISNEEAQGRGVNYNTLALGREGYMSMNMVGPLDQLPQLKRHSEELLRNVTFVEGKRYADFNSATDKVAAVGLSALIAGAALKSGLLAKLWAFIVPLVIAFKKLIVLVLIGIGVLLRKFFKKPAPPTPAS